MNHYERMLSEKLYHGLRVEEDNWLDNRRILTEFNSLPEDQSEERMSLLRGLLGTLPEDATITPPFYCDKGAQIRVGHNFYANTDLLILDEAPVTIGDNVLIGPRVSIYTAQHPIHAKIRALGLETAHPVTIGNDVWIGGNVVINPGITIGNGAIIGSGSVVTKDIPPSVIAGGNPCRVIREITPEDEAYWEAQYQDYITDPDIQDSAE